MCHTGNSRLIICIYAMVDFKEDIFYLNTNHIIFVISLLFDVCTNPIIYIEKNVYIFTNIEKTNYIFLNIQSEMGTVAL